VADRQHLDVGQDRDVAVGIGSLPGAGIVVCHKAPRWIDYNQGGMSVAFTILRKVRFTFDSGKIAAAQRTDVQGQKRKYGPACYLRSRYMLQTPGM
jgi:hypothetical protein